MYKFDGMGEGDDDDDDEVEEKVGEARLGQETTSAQKSWFLSTGTTKTIITLSS